MSITRAQSLSLAVLVLGLTWLLERKHLRLFFLGFLYVWLYNAFPLLLVLAGVYAAAAGWIERRLDLRPVLYTGAGIAAGLIINPYFPYNIVFAFQHILPKLVETTSVSVGSEWYPYDTGQLMTNSPLALLAWAGGALALGLSGRRMDGRTAAGFGLACLFGFMLFQSRRFIEYFPPFALIFAAFAWSPVIDSFRDRGVGKVWKGLPWTRSVVSHLPAARCPCPGAVGDVPGIHRLHPALETVQPLRRRFCLAGGQYPCGGACFSDRLGRFPPPVLLQHPQHLPGWPGSDLSAAVRPGAL
jgi:hypothetical protein